MGAPRPMDAPSSEARGVVIPFPRRRRRSASREIWLAVLAAGVSAALLFGLARPFDAHGQAAAAPPPPVAAE